MKYRDLSKCHDSLASLVTRRRSPRGEDMFSYCKGMVAQMGEKLSGHHAKYTLGILDEASGIDDDVKAKMEGWAKKFLIIGNCWQPQGKFFLEASEGGDILKTEAGVM